MANSIANDDDNLNENNENFENFGNNEENNENISRNMPPSMRLPKICKICKMFSEKKYKDLQLTIDLRKKIEQDDYRSRNLLASDICQWYEKKRTKINDITIIDYEINFPELTAEEIKRHLKLCGYSIDKVIDSQTRYVKKEIENVQSNIKFYNKKINKICTKNVEDEDEDSDEETSTRIKLNNLFEQRRSLYSDRALLLNDIIKSSKAKKAIKK